MALDPAPDDRTAQELAERVMAAVEPPVEPDGLSTVVEVSIGVARAPRDARDGEALLRAAGAAADRASERHQPYALFSPERDGGNESAPGLLVEVRSALARGELEVHYQPKLALHNGHGIAGVEALVRWRRPGHGLVPPGDFLPPVERSGLIRDLTLQVLDTAAADCARWRAQGLELGVAVNLSATNLLDLEIAHDIALTLARHRMPPPMLELEVTEGTLMVDRFGASGVLGGLRAMGVSVAIDDFGTGYSSLALLRELPVDTLKVDRSFVTGMTTSHGDEAIVRALVTLARDLGLVVVAEGVESQDALDAVTALGCDLAQGFLIAPALPADELTELVGVRSAGSSAVRAPR
jgi:EAL domain-containing protein (putative c-di-GMP-specific phosphodiesterase class I)